MRTQSQIHSMVPDKFVEGNILFADGNSLKTTDGKSVHLIVGNPTVTGYVEGTASLARFSSIGGIYQINRTHVVLSDINNHCLRMVHRETYHTAPFVGRCGAAGHRDGIDPQFHSPRSIDLLSENPPVLIVSDYYNNALRAVNLLDRNVSTLPLASKPTNPRSAMLDKSRDALFFSILRQIRKVNLVDYSVEIIAGSGGSGIADGWFNQATFGDLWGIVKLSENVLVVADQKYSRLRVLDLQQQSVRSILTGGSDQDADSNIRAGWVPSPQSLLVVDGFLYIGGSQVMKRVKGEYVFIKFMNTSSEIASLEPVSDCKYPYLQR